MKEKVYSSRIGPDTLQEAEMIHKGVYDATDVWRPKTFVSKLVEVGRNDFKEFEEKELQYYVAFFVSFYVLKYLGVVVALKFYPALAKSIL